MSDRTWFWRRRLRKIETILLVLYFSYAYFRLLIDLPYIIIFFRNALILAGLVMLQELALMAYQKIRLKMNSH